LREGSMAVGFYLAQNGHGEVDGQADSEICPACPT